MYKGLTKAKTPSLCATTGSQHQTAISKLHPILSLMADASQKSCRDQGLHLSYRVTLSSSLALAGFEHKWRRVRQILGERQN